MHSDCCTVIASHASNFQSLLHLLKIYQRKEVIVSCFFLFAAPVVAEVDHWRQWVFPGHGVALELHFGEPDGKKWLVQDSLLPATKKFGCFAQCVQVLFGSGSKGVKTSIEWKELDHKFWRQPFRWKFEKSFIMRQILSFSEQRRQARQQIRRGETCQQSWGCADQVDSSHREPLHQRTDRSQHRFQWHVYPASHMRPRYAVFRGCNQMRIVCPLPPPKFALKIFISRGSGLILVCPCICVRPSWADKTSVLPLFQWSQTGITVGADTLRGTLQVTYGIILFFCSDEEKMTYEITIEML